MAIIIEGGEPRNMKATKSEKMKKFEERITPQTIKDYLAHCRDNFSLDKEVVEYLTEKIDNNAEMAKKIDELELTIKSKGKGSYEPYIETATQRENEKLKKEIVKLKENSVPLKASGKDNLFELRVKIGEYHNKVKYLDRVVVENETKLSQQKKQISKLNLELEEERKKKKSGIFGSRKK